MKHAREDHSSDETIRAVVVRLARPHRSGGSVIERAAIMAEGARSAEILDWIARHAGEPEIMPTAKPRQGLHGTGFGGEAPTHRGPARYLLPAGSLTP